MAAPTPLIIDLFKVGLAGYIVEPRTSCYALQFNTVVDCTIEFRYREGQPWLKVVEGDFYDFSCEPIQDGILYRLTSTGLSPAAVVQLATTPGSLSTV